MDQPGQHVAEHEYVYRRIPWVHYSNPEKTPIPAIAAFLPTPSDADGLSVHRASLISIGDAASGRGKRYHVARVHVRALNGMGLDVIEDRLENDPSHALIPQLNRSEYERDRPAMKAIANRLLTEVSELVLVALNPDEFPDVHTS